MKGLRIATNNQLVELTLGQHELLSQIVRCTKNFEPLTMRMVVDCYVKSRGSDTFTYSDWDWNFETGKREYFEVSFSITECFERRSPKWTYRMRALIKQWLISNIGALVIKNKLIAIPIIEEA